MKAAEMLKRQRWLDVIVRILDIDESICELFHHMVESLQ